MGKQEIVYKIVNKKTGKIKKEGSLTYHEVDEYKNFSNAKNRLIKLLENKEIEDSEYKIIKCTKKYDIIDDNCKIKEDFEITITKKSICNTCAKFSKIIEHGDHGIIYLCNRRLAGKRKTCDYYEKIKYNL